MLCGRLMAVGLDQNQNLYQCGWNTFLLLVEHFNDNRTTLIWPQSKVSSFRRCTVVFYWRMADVCADEVRSLCARLQRLRIFSGSSGTRDAVVLVADKFGFSMNVKFKVLEWSDTCCVKLGFSLMSLNRDASPAHLCFRGCVKKNPTPSKEKNVRASVFVCLRLHRLAAAVTEEWASKGPRWWMPPPRPGVLWNKSSALLVGRWWTTHHAQKCTSEQKEFVRTKSRKTSWRGCEERGGRGERN